MQSTQLGRCAMAMGLIFLLGSTVSCTDVTRPDISSPSSSEIVNNKVAIMTQPSAAATSGVTFASQPAVQLRDASNAVMTIPGVVVTAGIATGTGTLGGTTTATTDTNGLATFTSLSITGSGSFTLRFTATGLTAATSAAVTVSGAEGGSSFSTPDILNNASFETGFDGFTDGAGGTPNGVTHDNTLAYSGSWSVKRSWVPNPGGDLGANLWYTYAGADHIWLRLYFRATASISTIMKFARFYSPSRTALGGLFMGQGNDIFTFSTDVENGSAGTEIGLTESRVVDGKWHSLEIEYWRNGDPTGYASAAFWFDDQPIGMPDGQQGVQYAQYGQNKMYWRGGRVYVGERNSTVQLGANELLATLNGGNTTTGQINIDRVAISTLGRIGP
jgi:hypothetical protein